MYSHKIWLLDTSCICVYWLMKTFLSSNERTKKRISRIKKYPAFATPANLFNPLIEFVKENCCNLTLSHHF